MKYPRETLERFIEDMRLQSHRLSKWEADYVESVAEQLELRGRLSDRQIEILDRIYTERTP